MSSFSTCHSVSGHVDHNSSLTFSIYIYISFCTKSVFFKLEKEKRPRVFEEKRGGLLTSPKLAVCLRVQQRKKKSVWCLSSQSVCIVRVHIFVPRCPAHSWFHSKVACAASIQPSIQICFHKSFRGRWSGEEQQWPGEWREKEDESSAVFTVWSLGGILLPWPAPTLPPLTSGLSGIRSEGKQIRRVWGGVCVVAEEEVDSAGLLCSAVRVKAPPPSLPPL